MIKIIVLLTAIFFYSSSFAQTVKDTIYIKWDLSNKEMIRSKGKFTHPSLKNRDSLSFTYGLRFEEKTNVSFLHYIQSQKTIEYFNNSYKNPIKKIVDTSYLRNKKILDIDFFRKNDYKTIEKIFEGEKRSLEDNPFVWLYDLGEIEGGKVSLKQVWHIRHIDE